MFIQNSIHTLCLDALNHPITQALACGKRLPNDPQKELILTYGLLHLFVVSGAHAQFFLKILKSTPIVKKSWKTQISLLSLFLFACDFSAPLFRCYVSLILKNLNSSGFINFPKIWRIICSFIFLLPYCLLTNQIFSLHLSTYFTLLIHIISPLPKGAQNTLFFTLNLPIFYYLLGFPHWSAIVLTPFGALLIGFVFLPFSLLSVFSDLIEITTLNLWWNTLETLKYLDVFFNFPNRPKLQPENIWIFFFHTIILLLFCIIGEINWRRHTLFS